MSCNKPENKTSNLAFHESAELNVIVALLAAIAGIAVAALSMAIYP